MWSGWYESSANDSRFLTVEISGRIELGMIEYVGNLNPIGKEIPTKMVFHVWRMNESRSPKRLLQVDLNLRGYEWNTDMNRSTGSRQKCRRIGRGRKPMEVRLGDVRYTWSLNICRYCRDSLTHDSFARYEWMSVLWRKLPNNFIYIRIEELNASLFSYSIAQN